MKHTKQSRQGQTCKHLVLIFLGAFLLAGEAIVNMIDKQLCVFLAFVIVQLLRSRARKRQERQGGEAPSSAP